MWNDFAAFIFGRPVQRRLPKRVRAAIARQQIQAEILIGWTQAALVLFFLVLYSIARKPADGMLFHPVPWVLSAFLVFALVRLALSAHHRDLVRRRLRGCRHRPVAAADLVLSPPVHAASGVFP